MGGFHFLNRKSNAHTFTAVRTTMQLPSSTKSVYSTVNYGDNIIPEFFHGLTSPSNHPSVEAGVGATSTGGYFWFVLGSGALTDPDEWLEGSLPGVSNGNTIQMYLEVTQSGLVVRIYDSAGGSLFSRTVPMKQTAITTMRQGCYVYREATVAVNASFPSDDAANFSGLNMHTTVMYTPSGSGTTMTRVNTKRFDPVADGGSPNANAKSNGMQVYPDYDDPIIPAQDYGWAKYK